MYIYSYIHEIPKCGVGKELRKMGGVQSQPLLFGSSVANGNSHKKEFYGC